MTIFWQFMVIKPNMLQLQILTNVLQKSRAAVLMLYATIPKDLMTVNVNLDFQGMDGPAKVKQWNISGLIQCQIDF